MTSFLQLHGDARDIQLFLEFAVLCLAVYVTYWHFRK